jgi:hypothetical protein
MTQVWKVLAFDLIASVVFGVLIGIVYAKAYRGLLLSASFVHTCVVTAPLVALTVGVVRMVVTNDQIAGQALAFSLIGLLGLIRLRTVVRDTREFNFMFLAIVTGVAFGTGQSTLAAVGCVVLLGLLLLLDRTRFGAPLAPSLRVTAVGGIGAFSAYEDALSAISDRIEPLSYREHPDRGSVYTFEIAARRGQNLSSVATAIERVSGTTEVTVVRIRRGKRSEVEGD